MPADATIGQVTGVALRPASAADPEFFFQLQVAVSEIRFEPVAVPGEPGAPDAAR